MNIKFEQLQERHLDTVAKWRMSTEVTRFMYTDPVITKESQLKWYNSIRHDGANRNWVVSVDKKWVGFVNLKIEYGNKRGFWAYYIGEPEYYGKGIGKQIELNILKYVFDNLNLNKLTCEVFEFNDKVVKIHEKYGSQREGLLKEHVLKNNKYENIVVMGILKSEWNEIKSNFIIISGDIEYKEDAQSSIAIV